MQMTTRLAQAIEKIQKMPGESLDKLLDIIDPLIRYGLDQNVGDDERKRFAKLIEFSTLTRSVVGGFAYSIIVNGKNGIYAVDPEDAVVGRFLRFNGTYSTEEIEGIEKMVNANSRILVVGAHIGTLVIPLAKIAKYVTAIEANPNTFQLLELNLALNDLENCRAINVAAGECSGHINFLISRINSGGSKRKPLNEDRMYLYDRPEEVTIETKSLDQLLPNEHYDIVVMDLEGSEYFALKGMANILEKISILIIEFVPHHLKNVSGATVEGFLSLLTQFKYVTIPSRGIKLLVTDCFETLQNMYENEESDDGLIFEKLAISNLGGIL